MTPHEAAFEECMATRLMEHAGHDIIKGPGDARPSAVDSQHR